VSDFGSIVNSAPRDRTSLKPAVGEAAQAAPARVEDCSPEEEGEMANKSAFLADAEAILKRLLEQTSANRTTLRIDLPQFALNVNAPAAEVLAPGVHSIKNKTSLDQRKAVAVKWLEKNRRVFVENDCLNTTPDVAPEKEVTGDYGIRSEMVAPIIRNDCLIGWVSVHNTRGPHQWTRDEIAAIEQACVKVGQKLAGID
jgi:GAF domain-containing protein